ncbi:SGNH/GDSL hydrolase family protein [Loktanella sp. F6476L]|uniref:SGNH/GDSL hydrolase family protein n=1 Tax=Loktanella sp. F6476L TaxID=2926405 RepID=UPI001FF229F0|nr:SGNH/GDSL hydrolase family protein [Loktanella sp. F6476L]MCK0122130.1 SGNH/GDSL hydrolase family protein [Loktanella sp. F6476L]
MTEDGAAVVRATIETAFESAQAHEPQIAVQQFALARTQVLSLVDADKLDAAISREHATYARERTMYQNFYPPKAGSSRHVLIMGDSLGLPRPNDNKGEKKGAERTYTGLIYEKYSDRSVTSMCQRFFTTTEVRSLLFENADLGRDSDFLLHVGLNDCANRMFLENERIALSFLDPDTRNRLIEFSRKYRRDIIMRLPPHHYVPPTRFRDNLSAIVSMLRTRNARRIILATIILPPAKSWPGTPSMNRNFAAYNLDIMNTVYDHEIDLLDFDRHIWQAQNRQVLLPDGMHLSDAGHQLFTDKCDPFLR